MRTHPIIVAAIGVVAAISAAAALAQSTDIATCDRLAAYPDDPDRPEDVAGNYQIPHAEIATALKACKAAAGAADAPRRISFELGRAYELSRQPAEALKAYRKAIDAGSTSAMVGLGGLYAHGSGVKANAAEARKLFEQAATAGNPLGMINLGSIYGAGVGVPVDFAKARSWFEKAAAANSPEAMFQLGMMTQDGDGGPKDDAAAKAWFEKAAALNHAGAIERLGAYAEAGRAGPKDMAAAMSYYKKAAAMGEEDAQAALKRLRCPFTLKDKNGKVGWALTAALELAGAAHPDSAHHIAHPWHSAHHIAHPCLLRDRIGGAIHAVSPRHAEFAEQDRVRVDGSICYDGPD